MCIVDLLRQFNQNDSFAMFTGLQEKKTSCRIFIKKISVVKPSYFFFFFVYCMTLVLSFLRKNKATLYLN